MRFEVRFQPGDEVEMLWHGRVKARGIVIESPIQDDQELTGCVHVSWFTNDGSALKSRVPGKDLTKIIRVGPDPAQFDLKVTDAELAEVYESIKKAMPRRMP